MNKVIKKIILVSMLLIMILSPSNVMAKQKVNLYLFYGQECPHCEEEINYLETLKKKYTNLAVYKYEVWHNQDNVALLKRVETLLNKASSGVPYTVIGDVAYAGFNKSDIGKKIEKKIKYYSDHVLQDKTGILLGVVAENNNVTEVPKEEEVTKFNLPLLGNIDAKTFSLPLISIVIGIVDGFNPCAMWVLLFLISMLLGMKNKKRMLTLGISFLVTSALIYALFMLTWLKLTTFIGSIVLIRIIIAIVALIGSYVNIKSYFKNKEDGCEVVDDKKRNKVIERIKKFTTQKSFIFALFGVIALAVSVNFIELACSAGLPVIFMQILSLNNLSNAEYFIYMFIYILFFLIDDIVIFIIAMRTFELKGISTKYGKLSHLIGGLLMLIIGVLLIVKPEWLMFNF